ncbi:MAG: ABC transporter substrate-binding protein, partial [Erysipelotrichaceae bacterium]
KPFVDFLVSQKMVSIFSANGKFPSTLKSAKLSDSTTNDFIWAGWDLLQSQDIPEILKKAREHFYQKKEQ